MIFRKKACIGVIWCLCITSVFGAEEMESTPLKIKSVTLSPSFAWLSGTVEMKLDSGFQKVTVRLPIQKVPSNSNISVGEGIQVMNVSFREAFRKDDRIKVFQDSIKKLHDSLTAVELDLQVAQARQQVLWDNRQIRVSDKSIYTDDLDELNQFLSKELSSILLSIQTLKEIKVVLHNSVSEITSELRQQAERNQIVYCDMTIFSPKTLKVESVIFIQTEEAGWSPSYVIDYQTSSGTYDVTPVFEIWQNTLHAWNNINISVMGICDTINPSNFLPETYNLGRLTLSGNSGKKTRVYHNKKSHRGQLKYVCDLSLEGQMTLNLKILDLQNSSYQSGIAYVSLEGNFLGQSTFSSKVFSDTFTTKFLHMPGVYSRKEVVKEKTKKTITGKKNKNEVYYRIDVKSDLSYSIDVEIIDIFNIDDASDEKVNFDLPKGSKILQNGRVTMPLKLEPNSSKTLDYGVRVSF